MKPDWYTKIVLTLIALFLGTLALGRGGGTAVAQAAAPADAFENVVFIPNGNSGFIMLDKRTGGVWAYDQKSEKGFPFELWSRGRIEKPGAPVEKLP